MTIKEKFPQIYYFYVFHHIRDHSENITGGRGFLIFLCEIRVPTLTRIWEIWALLPPSEDWQNLSPGKRLQ